MIQTLEHAEQVSHACIDGRREGVGGEERGRTSLVTIEWRRKMELDLQKKA